MIVQQPKPPKREPKARKPIPRVSQRRREKRAARRRKVGPAGLVRYGDVLKVADDLWSVWVRASAPGCVVCSVPSLPSERQCAHGWTRECHPTRFEPDNTFSACPACHRRHTPPRPDWYSWMKHHLGGDRFARVELMASVRGRKYTTSELHLVILDAQQRIASLPSGERKAWALERREAILARLAKAA